MLFPVDIWWSIDVKPGLSVTAVKAGPHFLFLFSLPLVLSVVIAHVGAGGGGAA